MPGARSVVSRKSPEKVFEPKAKRAGKPTQVEQSLITQFVRDQPREVTSGQVAALARVLRRPRETVKSMIEAAREDFAVEASFYVAAHKTSVQRALDVTNKDGEHDAKALDVAARASQWALENLSAEGVRVVDKPSAGKGDTGPRIMVGINVGGLNTKPTVEVVEQDPPTPGSNSEP